jgi:hypothetical protein
MPPDAQNATVCGPVQSYRAASLAAGTLALPAPWPLADSRNVRQHRHLGRDNRLNRSDGAAAKRTAPPPDLAAQALSAGIARPP